MASLEELAQPPTQEEIEQTGLELMEGEDLPTTAWQATSVPRVLFAFITTALADAWISVAAIANGMVLGLSRGPWLTRLLRSAYSEAKVPATFTVGDVVLVDSGGGPHTITAGAFLVGTAGQEQVFRALTGGTLPLNGALTITVRAQAVGGAFNVPNGTIVEVISSAPTVTVTNPAIGTTGTWITSLGANEESDEAATVRAAAKWATLSTGSPALAYLYWALSTVGVTRAKVDARNPDGANTLRVYLDNPGAVATLQAFLATKAPSGTRATVSAATAQTIDIPAVVTVSRALRTTSEAQVAANLVAYQNEVDIGDVVRQSEIIERIMSATGVVDVELGSAWAGTPNITLGTTSIAVFAPALTFVEVE